MPDVSKSSSVFATLVMKSVLKRSVIPGAPPFMVSMDDGEGAVMGLLFGVDGGGGPLFMPAPGAGVGGAVPVAVGVCRPIA